MAGEGEKIGTTMAIIARDFSVRGALPGLMLPPMTKTAEGGTRCEGNRYIYEEDSKGNSEDNDGGALNIFHLSPHPDTAIISLIS